MIIQNYVNGATILADSCKGIKVKYVTFVSAGFRSVDGDYIELDHCSLSCTNSDYGVLATGTGLSIHDCTFLASRDPNSGSGDDCIKGPGPNSSVYNCTFIGVPITNYTAGQHQDGLQCWVSGLRVYNNYFYNLGNSATFIAPFTSPATSISNIWIYNNVVENCWQNLAMGNNGPGSVDWHSVVVANNLVVDSYSQGLIFANHLTAQRATNIWFPDCVIANNVLCNGGDIIISPGASASNNVSITSAMGAKYFVSYTPATNNWITADRYNFHLTSAATDLIGKGANLSSFFQTDKDGKTRPALRPWSIGPYEVEFPRPPQGLQLAPKAVELAKSGGATN